MPKVPRFRYHGLLSGLKAAAAVLAAQSATPTAAK